jgi:hypothetical protein
MVDLAKLGALALVGAVFLYGLKKDWEGVYFVFGIVFLLGSCQMLGI